MIKYIEFLVTYRGKYLSAVKITEYRRIIYVHRLFRGLLIKTLKKEKNLFDDTFFV